jgi:hypothetical protein
MASLDRYSHWRNGDIVYRDVDSPFRGGWRESTSSQEESPFFVNASAEPVRNATYCASPVASRTAATCSQIVPEAGGNVEVRRSSPSWDQHAVRVSSANKKLTMRSVTSGSPATRRLSARCSPRFLLVGCPEQKSDGEQNCFQKFGCAWSADGLVDEICDRDEGERERAKRIVGVAGKTVGKDIPYEKEQDRRHGEHAEERCGAVDAIETFHKRSQSDSRARGVQQAINPVVWLRTCSFEAIL